MVIDKNRIAIITGASSGFGKIFARELEKNLDLEEIWLIARRTDLLEETAKYLKRVRPVIITADLSTKKGVDRITDKIVKESPEVRVLINNAGFGKTEEFIKGDEAYYENMINVNIRCPLILTKRAVPFMSEGSKIINLSSSAAFSPMPYFAVYAATKSFLLSFSCAINEELKKKDITVTTVCPGPAATEFFKTGRKKVNGLKIEDPKKIVRKAIRDARAGRLLSVYGFQMNLMRFFSKIIPLSVLCRISAKVKLPE